MPALDILWLTLPFIGAWLGRMNGGAPPKLSFGLDAWLISIPFALLTWEIYRLVVVPDYGSYGFFQWNWLLALLPFSFSFLGQRLGHGQYFDLGSVSKIHDPEKIDLILNLIFGEDAALKAGEPNFKRDYTGLSITGLVTGLGLSLLFCLSGMWLLAAISLSFSALKGACYFFGKLPVSLGVRLPHLNSFTEWGELFFGFSRIAALAGLHFLIT